MGTRSTLTSFDYKIVWPEWFREKYADLIWFPEGGGPLQSKKEAKVYTHFETLHNDVQSAIEWGVEKGIKKFVLLFLNEYGTVMMCMITKDAITWSQPEAWADVPESYALSGWE